MFKALYQAHSLSSDPKKLWKNGDAYHEDSGVHFIGINNYYKGFVETVRTRAVVESTEKITRLQMNTSNEAFTGCSLSLITSKSNQ